MQQEKRKNSYIFYNFYFKKGSKTDILNYYNLDNKNKIEVEKKKLGTKWIFNKINIGENRFGDYFKVSNSIATLCNKAYVITEKDEIFYNKDEKKIIKNAVSPKSIESSKKEKIIFPYYYNSKML